MSRSYFARVLPALLTIVVAIGISGCAPTDPTTAQSTASTLPTLQYAPSSAARPSAAPVVVDYRRLLLSAADPSDADDTFTERSKASQPNGMTGATAFFVNAKDTRAISDTFLIYPDAAIATATLKQMAGTLPTLVAGGTPAPMAVGADGVVISGTHPNEDKAVTLALFTEGRALVRLEFQSAMGDTTTDRFVTSVAKMQQVALRIGLADPSKPS